MGLRRHRESRGRTGRERLHFLLIFIAGVGGLATPMNSIAFEPSAGFGSDWQALGLLTRGEETPRSLAQQAAAGRFALADADGVSLLRAGRRDRAALEGVNDLAFDRDGTLWIGTETGLYRWNISGRPERRPLRGGESANRILRIATNETGILLGTEAGAFWSSSGRSFQFLVMDGAATSIPLIALDPLGRPSRGAAANSTHSSIRRCWVLRGGELFELRGFVSDAGFRLVGTRRLTMPRVDEGREPIDLYVDASGSRLLLIYRDIVAVRPIGGDATTPRSSDWRIERPVLSPGAEIRRLAWGAKGRIRIATDHGLLEATEWEGPFQRSPHPLGSSECRDVQGREEGAFVALCRRGIYLQSASPKTRSEEDFALSRETTSLGADPSRRELEVDPPLAEIRARAIRRSGLSVERSDRLRDGLSRRAYWPEISIRVGADIDRDRQTDRDQSFVSGEKRYLLDRTHDRGLGFAATLQFDWDLGGIVYPNEVVGLSRELRLVLSLRDDVSDEINQLYFERQAIRERLAIGGFLDPIEATRLRLRAAEIEAGLDAWTGGWIGRWRADRERKSRALQSESKRATESSRSRNQ